MRVGERTKLGAIERESSDGAFDVWRCDVPNGGLLYDVSDCDLRDAHLSVDLLVRGERGATFEVRLLTDRDDAMYPRTYAVDLVESPGADVVFQFVPGVQGRIRFEVASICDGDPPPYPNPVAFRLPNFTNDVPVEAVEYVQLRPVGYERTVRWAQTEPTLHTEDPGELDQRELTTAPLLDRYGRLATLEGVASDEDPTAHLPDERTRTPDPAAPAGRSEWGGSTHRQFEATGYFDTHHDGERWWLVDPDGHPFWSVGINDVRPNVVSRYDDERAVATPDDPAVADVVLEEGEAVDGVDSVAWNFCRAFGTDEWREAWTDVTVTNLRELGFNTAGTWIDDGVRERCGLPYVRILDTPFEETPTLFEAAGTVFPDVFHDSFEDEAAAIADQLAETASDPALLGYYLGNYPTLSLFPPAEQVLLADDDSATRDAFVDYLRETYGSERCLSRAWGCDVTFGDVRDGGWDSVPREAESDVEYFSGVLVNRLFGTLSAACRAVDDNHLNLGPRVNMHLPRWLLRCVRHVDVFCPYGYVETVSGSKLETVAALVDTPVLLSEWTVGAVESATPFAGYCRVRTEADRARAYRRFVEDAAAAPWCVGAHFFSYYDQPTLGREDGEAYNTGLFDLCNRRYDELARATRASLERVYDVRTGAAEPYAEEPDRLPRARSNV